MSFCLISCNTIFIVFSVQFFHFFCSNLFLSILFFDVIKWDCFQLHFKIASIEKKKQLIFNVNILSETLLNSLLFSNSSSGSVLLLSDV